MSVACVNGISLIILFEVRDGSGYLQRQSIKCLYIITLEDPITASCLDPIQALPPALVCAPVLGPAVGLSCDHCHYR